MRQVHLDYTENLQGTPKYEPQSAHFSKKQYTLHCTVAHVNTNDKENYEYLYHLSNDTKYDSAQILGIIHNIISTYGNINVYRFKSENAAAQYKTQYMFFNWRQLAKSLRKKFIIYFGVSGHGKGLVDAMSAFGVKGPLRNYKQRLLLSLC